MGFVLGGTATSTGPLGDFTLFAGSRSFSEYYVQFFGWDRLDEIDILAGRPPGSALPALWTFAPWIAPEFTASQLYRCGSDACVPGFSDVSGPLATHPLDITVRRVPMNEDGSTFLLLTAGIAALTATKLLPWNDRRTSRS